MNTCIGAGNTRSSAAWPIEAYSKSKSAFSIAGSVQEEILPSSNDTEGSIADDCHKLLLTDGRTLYASRDLHTIPEEEDEVIHTILTVSTRHCRRNAVTDFGDFFEGLWDRMAEQQDENKPQRKSARSRRCDAWDDLQFKEHFRTVCF